MSGGYGGLFALNPLSCQVDTEELPDSDSQRLADLVRRSGLLTPPAERPSPGAGPPPDVYAYELSVADGGELRTFFFDDTTVPSEVRPLLQYLQECAVQNRMKGG